MSGDGERGGDEPSDWQSGKRLRTWVLLEGDRLVLATLLVAAVAGVVLLMDAQGLFTARSTSASFFLFSGLLGGNVTLITVVLSINQLVLSRELGDPSELSARVEGAVSYRREVESHADATSSPVEPGEFLRFLHDNLAEQARQVQEILSGVDGDDLRERNRSLVDSIRRDVERVDDALAGPEDDIFTVLSATIATNHATQIKDAADLLGTYEDDLDDGGREELEELLDRLFQIDIARKYFETVYVQRELAYLSRVLLYVGLPAVVLSAAALLRYAAISVTPTQAGVAPWFVPAALVVGFAPIAVLFSFVLRLSWVAQETATVAPFTVEGGD